MCYSIIGIGSLSLSNLCSQLLADFKFSEFPLPQKCYFKNSLSTFLAKFTNFTCNSLKCLSLPKTWRVQKSSRITHTHALRQVLRNILMSEGPWIMFVANCTLAPSVCCGIGEVFMRFGGRVLLGSEACWQCLMSCHDLSVAWMTVTQGFKRLSHKITAGNRMKTSGKPCR